MGYTMCYDGKDRVNPRSLRLLDFEDFFTFFW